MSGKRNLEINDITMHVTTLVNGLLANIELKESAGISMLTLIGLACQRYHNDESFRVQMDALYVNLKKSRELQAPMKKLSP